ncbi:MRN complex-interacting protein isoform X4 [Pipistrellus kuhlii]|uniref:MRN complex-interacting protein isoform X4 n=1 Tax=Pipistrellus kuhlii TaxID=59472 RepID=UPI00174F17D4|nr:MRN complex-interacting protein isoform X4 [Pipistrellus kuhlii]
MAPPPQARVLRCCRCRLFQAHQMKKSLKWTCKACGEKQSFLRAYGEGSGADCRRHVQKLNLLQGQLSEMSPRTTLVRQGRQEKEAVERMGTPGSSLALGGNHYVLPSRSGPRLSGNDFFCRSEPHMWTQHPRHPCRGTPGQLGQHRLSRGPPELKLQKTGASAGHPICPSFLGPHTLLRLGPGGPWGRPLSSGVQALRQRVGPWSKGHMRPERCSSVTSLPLVRTLMTL